MRVCEIIEEIKDIRSDPSRKLAERLLASLPDGAMPIRLPLPLDIGVETGYIGYIRIVRAWDPIHDAEFIAAACGIEE